MSYNILVLVDGSRECEAALLQAVRFAGADGRTDLLGTEADVEAARGRHPAWTGRSIILEGEPVECVAQAVKARDIQLIVLAPHGRTGPAQWLTEGCAGAVLRSVDRPVLTVRDGPPPRREVQRILVPLHGWAGSLVILDDVKPIAIRTGAEVVVLHVLDESHDPMPQFAPRPGLTTHDPGHRYQEIADELDEEGILAWSLVARGDPARQIAAKAKELDVDLIAMATHGYTWLERMFVRSVAERVRREVAQPVLLRKVGVHVPAEL